MGNSLQWAIGFLMGFGRAPLVVTKTVGELLFDGYDDPLLTLLKADNNPDIPKPPFDKFGWFVDRNDSYTYDGNFTMFDGTDDIFNLGNLQLWNDESNVHKYRGDCDKVLGTTGELLPPIRSGEKPDLTVFATDICRGVTIKYDSDYESHGIKGYKWIADESVFDNGVKYPEKACYCSAQEGESNLIKHLSNFNQNFVLRVLPRSSSWSFQRVVLQIRRTCLRQLPAFLSRPRVIPECG